MEWTEPKPPTEGESYYDHVKCETPLGTAMIEWKSWKRRPSYDLMVGNEWVGAEYTLEDAKEAVRKYLDKIRKEIDKILD